MSDCSRRSFIRTVGGSVIAAALPPFLAGCSTDFPPESVAAWQGPPTGVESRRWALAYAILAPNSHNRQPWLVDLREPNSITLYVDRERLLPQTDPWFRQIIVSQGTFLEALVIALRQRGISPRVTLFPDGEFAPRALDDRPVARVSWTGGTADQAHADPLFAQILRRHTAKVDYDLTQPVAPAQLAALSDAFEDPSVVYGATVDPVKVTALRALCWESARVELLTPRTVMESVRLTRVGPAEIARYRDGIPINDLIPRMADAVGAFDREHAPAEGSTAYSQMMKRFEGHSRTAMGFLWLSTPRANGEVATRSAEVRAGRAYYRLQLKATELGLQVHPMSQAVQEFPEMKGNYSRLHQLLVGKSGAEEPVQMFCRVGHCAPTQPTPRRGVDAIVRT